MSSEACFKKALPAKARSTAGCCFPCAHTGVTNLKNATATATANVQQLKSHPQSNNSDSEGWSEDAHPRNYGRVGLLHPIQEAGSQKIQFFLLKLLLVLFLTEENGLVSSTKCFNRFLVKTATGDHSHSRNGQWSVRVQYSGCENLNQRITILPFGFIIMKLSYSK